MAEVHGRGKVPPELVVCSFDLLHARAAGISIIRPNPRRPHPHPHPNPTSLAIISGWRDTWPVSASCSGRCLQAGQDGLSATDYCTGPSAKHLHRQAVLPTASIVVSPRLSLTLSPAPCPSRAAYLTSGGDKPGRRSKLCDCVWPQGHDAGSGSPGTCKAAQALVTVP